MKIHYDKNTRYDSRDTRYEFEVAKNIKRNIIKKNFQLGGDNVENKRSYDTRFNFRI